MDLFSAIAVAEEVARRREVLLPPPIPVAFLFRTSSPTVSLRVETMRHLLDDYFRSLSEISVSKIVVLSGCGQPISALSALCKELGEKHGVKVILTRVKTLIRDEVEEFCGEGDTHAGCWETSIMLACREDLVRKEKIGSSVQYQPPDQLYRYVHLVHESEGDCWRAEDQGAS